MNCQAIMFESSTCANCVLSEVLILHSVVNRVCIQIVSFEGGGNNICLQKLCVIPENKPPFSPHGRQACPQSGHRPSGLATRTPPSTSSACRPPIKPNWSKYLKSSLTLQTGTSPSVFRVFLMNLRRCFWFMQEAAWMCVSTWTSH